MRSKQRIIVRTTAALCFWSMVLHAWWLQRQHLEIWFSSSDLSSSDAVAVKNPGADDAREQQIDGAPEQQMHGATNDSSSTTTSSVVEWMQYPDFLVEPDAFSASWLMNRQTFLESNLEAIRGVEDACFEIFTGRYPRIRMPLDWFDLAVEHMSKWWRILDVPRYDYAYERVVSIFEQYRLERLQAADMYFYDRSILHPTIGLIAFQQYKEEDNNYAMKSRTLTVASLSATIASLVQVGMGRIVVVGYEEEDEEVVREAFRLFSSDDDSNKTALFAHGAELAYARATDDMVKSKLAWVRVNLPQASLLGLRLAMIGNDEDWTRTWLGNDPSQWKYVYLTEPDTMLHTRPSTLPYLEEALQNGLILAPHRLQPIPFEDDFPESQNDGSFVPSDFKTPIVLDALAGDACCDEQAGRYRPGSNAKKCGDFWWKCGFQTQNHSRLEHYDFMRLQQGTGVVSLAGTEHGRRCIPKKQRRCERRMSVNHPNHPDNPLNNKMMG